jgi:hypothetical protein
MFFFYAVELISAIAFTVFQTFSGLIWLAVLISFIGIIPKAVSAITGKAKVLIPQICLILSSLLWGYIMLYSLTSAPIIYTSILVARVIATLVAFKEIRDHIIVVLPLLVAFALLKPAGCVPPLSF